MKKKQQNADGREYVKHKEFVPARRRKPGEVSERPDTPGCPTRIKGARKAMAKALKNSGGA